jgi:hypothetical protein
VSCNLHILYDESTGLFRIEGLKKTVAGVENYVNDATVTLQEILDANDVDQLGGPVSLAYVAASNGDYEGFQIIDLTAEAQYTAKITAVSGTLQRAWWPRLLIEEDRN